MSTKSYPDASFLDKLSEVTVQPIFIAGIHKSGTSYLHHALARTNQFNYVNVYHILRYKELLSNYFTGTEGKAYQELDSEFEKLGLKNRLIDNVEVAPDLPEEYTGLLSNYVFGVRISKKNISFVQEAFRKIQLVSTQDRPLLLKNPFDFSGFVTIKELIPESKFVFIHRNPIHVVNSNIKMARELVNQENPYMSLVSIIYRRIFHNPLTPLILPILRLTRSSFLNLGVNRLMLYHTRAYNYWINNINSLPDKDYVNIRYEDLCQDPETTFRKIFDFLSIDGTDYLSDLASTISPRPIKLLPEVEASQRMIRSRLNAYFDHWGY